MYLRDVPTRTITDVREAVETRPTLTVQQSTSMVRADFEENVISLSDDIHVPLTADGVKALGTWLDIPHQFLLRQEIDIQQYLLTRRGERAASQGAFVYEPEVGLLDVQDPNTRVIPIAQLLDVASRVIDPSAPVLDFWSSADDFRLDIFAPEDFPRGVGGDAKVGDLSRAGVRLMQDRKHNLAPQVQPFQYRLRCTNGMTGRDDGLKIDARGSTVEEVLAAFEEAADRAFRRAEAEVSAFYDLRSQRVDNIERTLLRLGNEAKLPTRMVLRLQEQVPAMIQEEGIEEGDVSMFDLVNAITNIANDPSVKTGPRDTLQALGGSIVTDHSSRCTACLSRIVVHN